VDTAWPTAGLGVGVLADLRVERLRFGLEGNVRLPSALPGPVDPTGADVTMGAALARVCYAVPRVEACVGGELGVLEAKGYGITHPRSSSHLWAAGLGGLRLLPIEARVSPYVGIDVGAPIFRPTIDIEGVGPVARPAAIFARLYVGIDWKLGSK
jgi:hypothetical protein